MRCKMGVLKLENLPDHVQKEIKDELGSQPLWTDPSHKGWLSQAKKIRKRAQNRMAQIKWRAKHQQKENPEKNLVQVNLYLTKHQHSKFKELSLKYRNYQECFDREFLERSLSSKATVVAGLWVFGTLLIPLVILPLNFLNNISYELWGKKVEFISYVFKMMMN
jgi:hypothetical protein